MISSFCDVLRDSINEDIEVRRVALEAGTASRDADERLRGEIWGMRRAQERLDEVEERARRADRNDDDDML